MYLERKAIVSITKEGVVLGLDLGANSIGWALVQFKEGEPVDVMDMGVRIFEAGTDGNIEQGMDKSRAVERRESRQRRRQAERRARRTANLARRLQRHGLLPPGDLSHGKARHEYFVILDNQIRGQLKAEDVSLSDSEGARELPYYLRARALDEKLDLFAFGRALYHLGHRRGFLSNRKSDLDEKEVGPVKEGIAKLVEVMNTVEARTLGEYFYRVDPVQEKRIRNRWTARSMYADEFDALWQAQNRYYPDVLTDELRTLIYDTIFSQRELKSQKGLVGYCELEPKERRAPRAILSCQCFRMVQRVNDLIIHFPDGTKRELNQSEREKILEQMEQKEEVTFKGMRVLLRRLDKQIDKEIEFNLERGGETKLKGNVTAVRIRKAMGDKWDALDDKRKDAVVGEIMGAHKRETLVRRGKEAWGLNDEEAEKFSKISLEEGYGALSRKAIRKLLPLMEQGISFKTAENKVYGDLLKGRKEVDKLPPVKLHRNELAYHPEGSSGMDLRNPVVMRTLSELRKIVNALIVRYGKPEEIHIELARDLKKNREQRKRISKDNRNREKQRQDAVKRIAQAVGIQNPSRQDIEKVLLADECNWECPYTGKSISMATLLGEYPQFDIEHIVPFSRCLNDGFLNKTLCYHEENRSVKRNQTPWEAYGDTEKWEEMIVRVRQFRGDTARIKLERFQLREVDKFEEMAQSKLNDTRYASKLAARYLGMLYGDDVRSRIQTNTGQLTAMLRDAWKLNKILGDGGVKNRDDHRHHAIDALVIALTTRSAVKQLSDTALSYQEKKGVIRGFKKIMAIPWDTFLQDVQVVMDNMIVSHKVSHRVRGRLHEDTNYSSPREDDSGKTYHAVRKLLTELFKESDINTIIDPAIREAVYQHFVANGKDSKAAFGDAANHPKTKDGIPIHRVRIRKNISAYRIGEQGEPRYVTTDTNHHMEIVEITDAKGCIKWEGIIVDLLEAINRKIRKEPVVKRNHGSRKRLVCTLSTGDIFRIMENETEKYFIVRTISKGNVEVVDVLDARKKVDIKADKGSWLKRSADKLRQLSFQKLHVSPIGETYPAND